ncbi:hypothetical protein [Rathayibacter toxicus]|uniref:Uncharacterized protein n=1 Tax=Rathayibacter toxicus TaxID=145458 RepID=A0A2S5Y7W4_9MICO|nr:hypothetical protein [Rathayibacter toxicus]ALS56714.1 hypothetical protein APU90_02085 [Rathayibacter toxicus]PPG22294.1 hypothetical protein C5D15_04170 [Rathayibacter toxicus]PPG47129.1 hypothetical protein C5D16_04155 [Rathayibacter toxicus]PPH24314.1 hypothetical protein C5D17_04165 [Rathayibacter toxicus]PPH57866.1 hypothetical protein C5D30_04190 [Rathayibacter toxicus]
MQIPAITARSRASGDITERATLRSDQPGGWSQTDNVDETTALAEYGPTASLTRMRRINLETGLPEHGYRVWDCASEGICTFRAIETFPFDPE